MEPCVSCIYLTYCMEYEWTSSLWIGIFQRATPRTSKNTIDRQYSERGQLWCRILLVITIIWKVLLIVLLFAILHLQSKISYPLVFAGKTKITGVMLVYLTHFPTRKTLSIFLTFCSTAAVASSARLPTRVPGDKVTRCVGISIHLNFFSITKWTIL